MRRTATCLRMKALAMAIEMECSLRYQLEMSSRTVSWLMHCTRMSVTFVFDEKNTCSALGQTAAGAGAASAAISGTSTAATTYRQRRGDAMRDDRIRSSIDV